MNNLTGSGYESASFYTDSTTGNYFLSQSFRLSFAAYSIKLFLQYLTNLCTWSMVWKLAFVILAIGNLKNLPLIWHLRIVNAFRFCLRSQRPTVKFGPSQIFQPIITESHAPLMEIDFNLHSRSYSILCNCTLTDFQRNQQFLFLRCRRCQNTLILHTLFRRNRADERGNRGSYRIQGAYLWYCPGGSKLQFQKGAQALRII